MRCGFQALQEDLFAPGFVREMAIANPGQRCGPSVVEALQEMLVGGVRLAPSKDHIPRTDESFIVCDATAGSRRADGS